MKKTCIFHVISSNVGQLDIVQFELNLYLIHSALLSTKCSTNRLKCGWNKVDINHFQVETYSGEPYKWLSVRIQDKIQKVFRWWICLPDNKLGFTVHSTSQNNYPWEQHHIWDKHCWLYSSRHWTILRETHSENKTM